MSIIRRTLARRSVDVPRPWIRSPSPMLSPIGRARVERRERVLEDDLHPAPVGLEAPPPFESPAMSGAVEEDLCPTVGSISRSSSRPTVVLPQPDSPTRPSVSPRRISKLTPSTAWTDPTVRCRMPPLTGKCLTRSRTSTSGTRPARRGAAERPAGPGSARRPRGRSRGRSAARPCRVGRPCARRARPRRPARLQEPPVRVVVEPAADLVARARPGGARGGPRWPSRRRPRCARRAARREPAALRQVDEVGDVARDDGQLVLDLADDRDRADEARGCRGGRGWRKSVRDVGLLDDLARVHDRHAIAHLGDDAEVVGDEDDRRAGLGRAGCASGRGSGPGSSRRARSSARRR